MDVTSPATWLRWLDSTATAVREKEPATGKAPKREPRVWARPMAKSSCVGFGRWVEGWVDCVWVGVEMRSGTQTWLQSMA